MSILPYDSFFLDFYILTHAIVKIKKFDSKHPHYNLLYFLKRVKSILLLAAGFIAM